jgi:hypothetical protein
MELGKDKLEFVLMGEMVEPRDGVIAVDVGGDCIPGVIDHHFAGLEKECAATLVATRGEELVLEHLRAAPGPGLTIVMHHAPDLDCVVSAYLAIALARQGELPTGAMALAEYARDVDAGRVPPDGITLSALWALYTAAVHLRPARGRTLAENTEVYRSWVARGFELLDLVLETAPDHASEIHLPERLEGWEAEQIFLVEDIKRYGDDKTAACFFEIDLPQSDGSGMRSVNGMKSHDPGSALFKSFARAEGYTFTHVIYTTDVRPGEHTQPSRHVISVAPERGVWLRGLGQALERAEVGLRAEVGCPRPGPPRWPDVTNSDPWYDGRSALHGYTIVDTPHRGTLLTDEQVFALTMDTPTWEALGRPERTLFCPKGCRFRETSAGLYCPKHGCRLMPSLIDGRFQVESFLGEGAMGVVWKVRDRWTGRPYALKHLHHVDSQQAEASTRFRRAALVAGRVSHPNVVRQFHFGADAAAGLYTISEYVQGTDLLKDIDAYTGRWYRWQRLRHIMVQMCDALSAVHEAGVLHRDLKPANVMLGGVEPGDDRDDPMVKVLDFSISILADPEATRITMDGGVACTLAYAAPEQLAGGPIDERTDLYALGCIFYELLCGAQPFRHATDYRTMVRAKRSAPPPPLPRRHSMLDRDMRIEGLLFSLLQPDPGQRPRSALDARRAFEGM